MFHITAIDHSPRRHRSDRILQVPLMVDQVFLLTIYFSALEFVIIASVWVNPHKCPLTFI
jgi:hypothetical protein